MPHYRRNRVRGGTFFFAVNLLDRRLDLLVRHVDALRDAVRRVRTRAPFRADASRAPRPHALPVELAERRRRLPRPLARDQDRVRQVVARLRTAIGGYDQPRRTRYLAAPLLGAHNPRPEGFR